MPIDQKTGKWKAPEGFWDDVNKDRATLKIKQDGPKTSYNPPPAEEIKSQPQWNPQFDVASNMKNAIRDYSLANNPANNNPIDVPDSAMTRRAAMPDLTAGQPAEIKPVPNGITYQPPLRESLGTKVGNVVEAGAKGLFDGALKATDYINNGLKDFLTNSGPKEITKNMQQSPIFRGFTTPDLQNKNFLDQSGASMRAGTADMIESHGQVADWLGFKNLANDTKKFAVENRQGFEAPQKEFTWKSLLDPNFYATTVARAIPTTATMMATAPAGAEISGLFTTLKFLKGASPFVKYALASGGAGVSSAAYEAALEAGGVYEDARSRGMNEADANHAANSTFGKNLALLAATNTLEFATAFAPLGKLGPLGKALGKPGVGIPLKLAATGLQEGGEEVAQDVITRQSLGDPIKWDSSMKEQFAVGGLMGMGFGGAGVAFEHLDSIKNGIDSIKQTVISKMPGQTKSDFLQNIEEAKAQGIPQDQAEHMQLDAYTQTDEGKQVTQEAVQEHMDSEQLKKQQQALTQQLMTNKAKADSLGQFSGQEQEVRRQVDPLGTIEGSLTAPVQQQQPDVQTNPVTNNRLQGPKEVFNTGEMVRVQGLPGIHQVAEDMSGKKQKLIAPDGTVKHVPPQAISRFDGIQNGDQVALPDREGTYTVQDMRDGKRIRVTDSQGNALHYNANDLTPMANGQAQAPAARPQATQQQAPTATGKPQINSLEDIPEGFSLDQLLEHFGGFDNAIQHFGELANQETDPKQSKRLNAFVHDLMDVQWQSQADEQVQQADSANSQAPTAPPASDAQKAPFKPGQVKSGDVVGHRSFKGQKFTVTGVKGNMVSLRSEKGGEINNVHVSALVPHEGATQANKSPDEEIQAEYKKMREKLATSGWSDKTNIKHLENMQNFAEQNGFAMSEYHTDLLAKLKGKVAQEEADKTAQAEHQKQYDQQLAESQAKREATEAKLIEKAKTYPYVKAFIDAIPHGKDYVMVDDEKLNVHGHTGESFLMKTFNTARGDNYFKAGDRGLYHLGSPATEVEIVETLAHGDVRIKLPDGREMVAAGERIEKIGAPAKTVAADRSKGKVTFEEVAQYVRDTVHPSDKTEYTSDTQSVKNLTFTINEFHAGFIDQVLKAPWIEYPGNNSFYKEPFEHFTGVKLPWEASTKKQIADLKTLLQDAYDAKTADQAQTPEKDTTKIDLSKPKGNFKKGDIVTLKDEVHAKIHQTGGYFKPFSNRYYVEQKLNGGEHALITPAENNRNGNGTGTMIAQQDITGHAKQEVQSNPDRKEIPKDLQDFTLDELKKMGYRTFKDGKGSDAPLRYHDPITNKTSGGVTGVGTRDGDKYFHEDKLEKAIREFGPYNKEALKDYPKLREKVKLIEEAKKKVTLEGDTITITHEGKSHTFNYDELIGQSRWAQFTSEMGKIFGSDDYSRFQAYYSYIKHLRATEILNDAADMVTKYAQENGILQDIIDTFDAEEKHRFFGALATDLQMVELLRENRDVPSEVKLLKKEVVENSWKVTERDGAKKYKYDSVAQRDAFHFLMGYYGLKAYNDGSAMEAFNADELHGRGFYESVLPGGIDKKNAADEFMYAQDKKDRNKYADEALAQAKAFTDATAKNYAAKRLGEQDEEITDNISKGNLPEAQKLFKKKTGFHNSAIEFKAQGAKGTISLADGRKFDVTMNELFNRYVQMVKTGTDNIEEPAVKKPAAANDAKNPIERSKNLLYPKTGDVVSLFETGYEVNEFTVLGKDGNYYNVQASDGTTFGAHRVSIKEILSTEGRTNEPAAPKPPKEEKDMNLLENWTAKDLSAEAERLRVPAWGGKNKLIPRIEKARKARTALEGKTAEDLQKETVETLEKIMLDADMLPTERGNPRNKESHINRLLEWRDGSRGTKTPPVVSSTEEQPRGVGGLKAGDTVRLDHGFEKPAVYLNAVLEDGSYHGVGPRGINYLLKYESVIEIVKRAPDFNVGDKISFDDPFAKTGKPGTDGKPLPKPQVTAVIKGFSKDSITVDLTKNGKPVPILVDVNRAELVANAKPETKAKDTKLAKEIAEIKSMMGFKGDFLAETWEDYKALLKTIQPGSKITIAYPTGYTKGGAASGYGPNYGYAYNYDPSYFDGDASVDTIAPMRNTGFSAYQGIAGSFDPIISIEPPAPQPLAGKTVKYDGKEWTVKIQFEGNVLLQRPNSKSGAAWEQKIIKENEIAGEANNTITPNAAAKEASGDPSVFKLPADVDGHRMTEGETKYYVVKHLFDTIPQLVKIVESEGINDAIAKIKRHLIGMKFSATGSGFRMKIAKNSNAARMDDPLAGYEIQVKKPALFFRDQEVTITNFRDDIVKAYNDRISQNLGPAEETKAADDRSNVVEDGDEIRITTKLGDVTLDAKVDYITPGAGTINFTYTSSGRINGQRGQIKVEDMEDYEIQILKKAPAKEDKRPRQDNPYEANLNPNVDFASGYSGDRSIHTRYELWYKGHEDDVASIHASRNSYYASYDGANSDEGSIKKVMEWANDRLLEKYGSKTRNQVESGTQKEDNRSETPNTTKTAPKTLRPLPEKASDLKDGEFETYVMAMRSLMSTFADRIKAGALPNTQKDLRKLAGEVLGRFPSEDEWSDALEAAIQEHAAHMAIIENQEHEGKADYQLRLAKSQIAHGEKLEALMKVAGRSLEKTERQQYSTPIPLAAIANLALDLHDGDVVKEGSAGTGSLIIGIKARKYTVKTVELSPRRAAILAAQGITAENVDTFSTKIDSSVVIGNPPFRGQNTGKDAKGFTGNPPWKGNWGDLGNRFLAWDLRNLPEGGRLVYVVSPGVIDSMQNAHFRKWLTDNHTVRAMVKIQEGGYDSRGTSFGAGLIVVDKGKPKFQQIYDGDKVVLVNGDKGTVYGGFRTIDLGDGETSTHASVIIDDVPDVTESPEPHEIKSVNGKPYNSKATLSPITGTADSWTHLLDMLKPTQGDGTHARVVQSGNTGQRTGGNQPSGQSPDVRGSEQSQRPTNSPASNGNSGSGLDTRRGDSKSGTSDSSGGRSGSVKRDNAGDGDVHANDGGQRPSDVVETQQNGVSEPIPSNNAGNGRVNTKDVSVNNRNESGASSDTDVPGFVDYVPRKRFNNSEHLGEVVEPASMNMVGYPEEAMSSEFMPHEIVLGVKGAKKKLSDVQLEAVMLAKYNYSREKRGMLIADDTGLGKTAEQLGIVADAWHSKRAKRILIVTKSDQIAESSFVNENQEFKFDIPLTKITTETHENFKDNRRLELQRTKEMLAKMNPDKRQKHLDEVKKSPYTPFPVKDGAIVMSYFTFKDAQYAVEEWLSGTKDEVLIVFDESHIMKNVDGGAIVAEAGANLFDKFKDKAQFVYSSATAAEDIGGLEHLFGLKLWNTATFGEFRSKLQGADSGSRGSTKKGKKNTLARGLSGKGSAFQREVPLSMMEQIVRELKSDGQYVGRNLSMEGINMHGLPIKMTAKDKGDWNRAVDFVGRVARKAEEHGMKPTDRGKIMAGVVGYMRRLRSFYVMKGIIEHMKTNPEGIERFAISGFFKSGDEGNNAMLANAIKSINDQDKYKDDNGLTMYTDIPEAIDDKNSLLAMLAGESSEYNFEPPVPELPSPVKMLYDAFGEDRVAVISGDVTGKEKIAAVKEFVTDKKNIVFFTAAGNTGISLHDTIGKPIGFYHADYPYEAKEAKQSEGRVNRTGQVTKPTYFYPYTDSSVDTKFVGTLLARYEAMGALSRGNTSSIGGDSLGNFDFSGPVAEEAAERFVPYLDPDDRATMFGEWTREAFRDGANYSELSVWGSNATDRVKKLLNAMMFLDFDAGNRVFNEFVETVAEVKAEMEAEGGISDKFNTYKGKEVSSAEGSGGIVIRKVQTFITEAEKQALIKKIAKAEVDLEEATAAVAVSVQETIESQNEKLAKEQAKLQEIRERYNKLDEQYQAARADKSMDDKDFAKISEKRNRAVEEHNKQKNRIDETKKGITDLQKDPKTSVLPKVRQAYQKVDSLQYRLLNAQAEADANDMVTLIDGRIATTGLMVPIRTALTKAAKARYSTDNPPSAALKLDIRGYYLDDGRKVVGAVVPTWAEAEVAKSLNARLKYAGKDGDMKALMKYIEDGNDVKLENGFELHYMPKMELIIIKGMSLNHRELYTQLQGDTKDFGYMDVSRAFVVLGEAGLSRLIKRFPIVNEGDSGNGSANGTAVRTMPPLKTGASTTPSTTLPPVKKNSLFSAKVKDQGGVTRTQILQHISKEFRVPIGSGRYRGKNRVRGIYNELTNEMRTAAFADFVAIAHELGHQLDNKHSLESPIYDSELVGLTQNLVIPASMTKTDIRKEGVAEFMRHYLYNPNLAQRLAPTFYQHFENTMTRAGKMDAVTKLQDMIAEWYGQEAEQRVDGVTDFGRNRRKMPTKNELNDMLFEEIGAMERSVEKLMDGAPLADSKNPHMLAWRARGSAGRVKAFLEHGVMDEQGNKVGKSLNDILGGVPDLKTFRRYLESLRALELHDQGRWKTPISEPDAQKIVDKVENGPDAQEYADARDDLYAYENSVTDVLVDAGMLNAADVAEWRKLHMFYVPFYRVMEESGTRDDKKGGNDSAGKKYADLQNPVHAMKDEGSGKNIIDPLESIIKNTYLFLSLAERNKVGVAWANLADTTPDSAEILAKVPIKQYAIEFSFMQIADELQAAGFDIKDPKADMKATAAIFQQTFTPDRTNRVMNVWRDGKIQQYQVRDRELYDAMVSLDPKPLELWAKILGIPNTILKSGITLSPSFIPKNFMRGVPTLLMQSDSFTTPMDYLELPVMLVKNFVSAMRKDDAYWKWQASGGAQSTLSSIQEDYLEGTTNLILNRSAKEKIIQGSKSVGIGPLMKGLRTLSDWVNDPILMTEFQKALEKTGDITTAAVRSRDVDLDFNKFGSGFKGMNRLNAFFNIALNGPNKVYRTFKANKVRTTMRGSLFIMLPSMLLLMANWDDENYWDLAQWERDLFWCIPIGGGKFFKIPIPFEWGLIFKTIPERIMGAVFGKTKDARKEVSSLMKTTFDVMAPTVMPTYLLGYINWAAGMNLSTGTPTVPARLKDELPANQFKSTTSETAKLIGKSLNVPPLKIDQLVSDTTSTLGHTIVGIADFGLKATGAVEKPPIAPSGEKAPLGAFGRSFQKAFITDATTKSGASLDDFYTQLDKAESNFKKQKEGKPALPMPFELKQLHQQRDQLAAMRNVGDYVRASTKLTAEEKQRTIDVLGKGMNDLARQATKKSPQDLANLKKAVGMATVYSQASSSGGVDMEKLVDNLAKRK